MSKVYVPNVLQMSDSQREFRLIFAKDVRIKTNDHMTILRQMFWISYNRWKKNLLFKRHCFEHLGESYGPSAVKVQTVFELAMVRTLSPLKRFRQDPSKRSYNLLCKSAILQEKSAEGCKRTSTGHHVYLVISGRQRRSLTVFRARLTRCNFRAFDDL